EDALGLFGFRTQDELTFFKLLLSVKGIGPKAGLATRSSAELRLLERPIVQEDAAVLATVPGIGPKTAARVVLELKGKLKEEMFGEEARLPAAVGGADPVAQALQVLTGLGYTPAEAKEAVRRASGGNGGSHSVDQLVMANGMGVNIRTTSGPAIEHQRALASILTNLEDRDIFFVDEIHRLARPVEESLYPAMEDFKFDFVSGKGAGAQTFRLQLPRFT